MTRTQPHARTAHKRPESSNPPPPPPPPTRRKRLNYSRSSLACGACRNRKIRCCPAKYDPLNRCIDCVRLNKECIFSPVEKSSDPKVRNEGEIEVSYPPVPNQPEAAVEPAAPTTLVKEMAQPDVSYPPVQNAHPLVHEAESMYPLVHEAEPGYPLVQNAVPGSAVGTYFEAQRTWEMPGHDTIDPLVLGMGLQQEIPDRPDSAQGSWRMVAQPYATNPPAQNSRETTANPDPTTPRAVSFRELMEAASLPIQILWEDTNPGSDVPPERRWTREELFHLFHVV